jgi:DNA-binding transcriptional ArsR family regulator
MVEYSIALDQIFGSLSDSTRRDILKRVSNSELTVSEVAEPYDLTFAAVSKHLKVLEKAKLIVKKRHGKEQLVTLAPRALSEAKEYLDWYQRFMKTRLDSLDNYLNKEK